MVSPAQCQADGSRQVAPCAVAADGDALRVDAQWMGMLGHPLESGDGIVKSGWEWVFRAESVIHRQHHTARTVGQAAAQHIMGFEVANGPAATVVVDQRRPVVRPFIQRLLGRGPQGPVFAQCNLGGWGLCRRGHVDEVVLVVLHRFGIGLGQAPAIPVKVAGGDGIVGVQRRGIAAGQQVQQGFGLGINHGSILKVKVSSKEQRRTR